MNVHKEIKLGVCLPGSHIIKPSLLKHLRAALIKLEALQMAYRIIPEVHLTQQWEELDYIIYSGQTFDLTSKRMLQGFCAAGGQPVAVDTLLHLPGEITFQNFIDSLNHK